MRRLWGECKTDWGRFVRARREKLGLNHAELARRLGMHTTSISRTEVGAHPTIHRSRGGAWANALECPLAEIEIFFRGGRRSDNGSRRRKPCGGCEKPLELVLGGLCAECAEPFYHAYAEARKQARPA
ncbi:helix-turn-helix transcriptional regulator [Candidatus Wolfebacteria bacterium]|nr:helix-turn-helix transcriptional regulator [Candidatus Wolfebacteria bacterium]